MTADRPVVFVVDDDVRVREALSSLLASAGLDVAVFASATEFLNADKPDAAACLVLDLDQNVIERAVIASTGRTLLLPEPERRIAHAAPSSRTLAQVERDHIVATLRATNWVLGRWDGAAARLGLSRTTLISRMQRLGISAESDLRKSASQPAISRLRSAPAHKPQVAGLSFSSGNLLAFHCCNQFL